MFAVAPGWSVCLWFSQLSTHQQQETQKQVYWCRGQVSSGDICDALSKNPLSPAWLSQGVCLSFNHFFCIIEFKWYRVSGKVKRVCTGLRRTIF